jgi:transposase
LDYDKRVKTNEDKASELLSKNDDYQRLQDIPGIEKIVGRGFIGAVGGGKQFQNGRQVGAWLEQPQSNMPVVSNHVWEALVSVGIAP